MFIVADENNDENDEKIKPNAFSSGDLAFISMVFGKEGYKRQWCQFCNILDNDWKTVNYEPSKH